MKVSFTNLTVPDSIEINYFWSVYNLDGNLISSSTVKNPDFDFTESGTYHVQLVAISDNGCSDSLMKWNYLHVYPQPVAEFSADPEISMLSDNDGEVNFTTYLPSEMELLPVPIMLRHILMKFGEIMWSISISKHKEGVPMKSVIG